MAKSDEVLRKSASHVMYEIEEFRRSASMFLSGSLRDQGEVNTYLDDFAVHARNLYSFFYDDSPQKDDVVADYFLRSQESKSKFLQSRTPQTELSIIDKKAGKQVMHITFSRLKYDIEGKGWTVGIFYSLIEKTIEVFLSCLDSVERSWFNRI